MCDVVGGATKGVSILLFSSRNKIVRSLRLAESSIVAVSCPMAERKNMVGDYIRSKFESISKLIDDGQVDLPADHIMFDCIDRIFEEQVFPHFDEMVKKTKFDKIKCTFD